MQCQTALAGILKHGILEERQAELLTDGIRALLLESKGYQTKVFEFISSEHTAKNVLITATQLHKPSEKRQKEALEQVSQLKKDFGIRQHYLETLF
jgi:histone acetyltransferase (RNA polymerase elongator complex component)